MYRKNILKSLFSLVVVVADIILALKCSGKRGAYSSSLGNIGRL